MKYFSSEQEIFILDNLRRKRNKIAYYGLMIDKSFVERNEIKYRKIISKLKNILKERLNN